jgi:hypothetical protein
MIAALRGAHTRITGPDEDQAETHIRRDGKDAAEVQLVEG